LHTLRRQPFRMCVLRTVSCGISMGTALALTGCATGALFFAELTSHRRDVSDQPEYWGGYTRGATFELLQHVFAHKTVDSLELTPVAGPLSDSKPSGHGTIPRSVEEYQMKPTQWPDLLGVVCSGTRLETIGVEEWSSSGFRRYTAQVRLKAKILDGPFTGLSVDITPLSVPLRAEHRKAVLLGPRSELLHCVAKCATSKAHVSSSPFQSATIRTSSSK